MSDHPSFPVSADLRLVAVDMDGTLLDESGAVPAALWPLLDRLAERGIVFAPASGRQYATLRRTFGAVAENMTFIAENGTYVVRAGEVLSVDALDPEVVHRAVHLLREESASRDLGVVVCGRRSAYIERTDAAFRDEARTYYAALEEVDDVLAPDDEVLKIAVYDFGSSADLAPHLDDLAKTRQVVVSGQHWVDIMNTGVDKGTALQALQRALGVTREQTAAFGDYLNDAQMLDAAGLSFAMANAHPDIKARARYLAPSNAEQGVITVLERLLGD